MDFTIKHIFALLAVFLFSENIIAQNTTTDSLKTELANHRINDTTKINLLCDLADINLRVDVNLAQLNIDDAETISNKTNYNKGKARIFYLKGMLENIKADYKKSLIFFNESLKYYKSINNKKGVADVYIAFGITNSDLSQYEEALKNYKKATQVYKILGNKSAIATSLINSGNVYSETGRYNEAISNFNEALLLSESTKDEDGVSYVYSNLGVVYSKQGNYPLAIENYNKTLAYKEKTNDTIGIAKTLHNLGGAYLLIEKYDTALNYLQQSLTLSSKAEYKVLIAANYGNIGTIYFKKKQYAKALEHHNMSLKISEEINNLNNTAVQLIQIANVYSLQNHPVAARENFTKAKTISEQINTKQILSTSLLGIAQTYLFEGNNKKALSFTLEGKKIADELEVLENQKEASRLLFEIYKNIGYYKSALTSHEQFKTLSDSILNNNNIEKITQLEYEYKYEKALAKAEERETKLTKTVETTSKNLEKSQRNLLLGVIVFLVIAIVLGGIIFALKLRHQKTKTQHIIAEQKLLRSQMTPHFIFNSLSVLQGMILSKEEEKSVSYLSKFSKLLRITLENSRDKTVLLSQELEAVKNYLALQHIENENINFKLTVNDAIDSNAIKIPPMLIQPFVENAIEHAFKKSKENCTVEINLTLVNSKLTCVILDNGIGIDASEQNTNQNKKSLATTITSERLEYLSKDFKIKGSVTIEDRKKYNQQGTMVTLVIPYLNL